jgi:hypothetical protein
MPPTYTTLATWHIPLIDFLEGEFEFRSVFTQGGVEVASTVKSLDISKVSIRSVEINKVRIRHVETNSVRITRVETDKISI